MMAVFEEDDLQITVNNVSNARRFDDPSHGLSHCMKAVDFVIELSDRYLFIEFKDPQNPHSRTRNQQRFVREFLSGQIDDDLTYKYRDTFLYEWASQRANKPIHYLVLIALDSLTDADLAARTDDLMRKLPVVGASSWNRQIVHRCDVFNISSWNQYLPNLPVHRLSAP